MGIRKSAGKNKKSDRPATAVAVKREGIVRIAARARQGVASVKRGAGQRESR